MNSIEISNSTYRFASCIEEMQPDEFLYMLMLLVRHKNNEISAEDFRNMLTIRLLKIRKSYRYFRMSEDEKDVIHDTFSRIVDLTDSFYITEKDENGEVKALNLEYIKNMIPRIGRYYGPDDAMKNATFYEYKEAFNHYNQYQETRSKTDLDTMIAILYRPKKKFLRIRKLLANFDGQERTSFTSKTNPEKLKHRIRRISGIPDYVKLGVFLWFRSCMVYLREGRPVIDGHEVDLSVLYQGGDESGKPSIGLSGLLFSLTEGHVFGDLFETANANLYDVMARLYQLKIDFDNMKTPKK